MGKYLLGYLTFCSANPGGCSQHAKSGRCPGLRRIRGLVCIKKLQRNPADSVGLISYWKPWHTSMVFFHHIQHLPKRRGMAVAGKRLYAPRPGVDRSLVLDFPCTFLSKCFGLQERLQTSRRDAREARQSPSSPRNQCCWLLGAACFTEAWGTSPPSCRRPPQQRLFAEPTAPQRHTQLHSCSGNVGFCTAHPAPPLLNSPGSKRDFVSG